MSSPQMRRELIRLANRDRLDAMTVADILTLAEFYLMDEPEDIYQAWKDSFDVEP